MPQRHPPQRHPPQRDRGTVTAELAASLPVLVLVLGVALTAVDAASARVRLQDAAREAARLAARGDELGAQRVAAGIAPGADLRLHTGSADVVATVRTTVHPLTDLLPGLTVSATAVAALEPTGAAP
jgi:Flp pilus assembly protein TadG